MILLYTIIVQNGVLHDPENPADGNGSYVLDSNLLLPLDFPGIQGIQGIQGIHSCIMAVIHKFPGDSSTSVIRQPAFLDPFRAK